MTGSFLGRAADIVFGFAVRDVALEQPILAENRFEFGAPVIEAKWLRSLLVVQKVGRHRGNVDVELRGGGRGDASKPRGPRERNDSRCRTVMRREMIEHAAKQRFLAAEPPCAALCSELDGRIQPVVELLGLLHEDRGCDETAFCGLRRRVQLRLGDLFSSVAVWLVDPEPQPLRGEIHTHAMRGEQHISHHASGF